MCKFSEIQTSFYQSDLMLNYFKKVYKDAGRLYYGKLVGQFFEVKTKLAGNGWIFPHGPYNYNLNSNINVKEFVKFLKHVKLLAKEKRVDFVKVVPMLNYTNSCVEKLRESIKFFRSPKLYEYASWHAFLFLSGISSEELLMTFRKSTRYLIRKTQKAFGVYIKSLRDVSDKELVQFWKGLKFYSTVKSKILSFENLALLKKLLQKDSVDDIILASVYCNIPNCKGAEVGYGIFPIFKNRMFYQSSAFSKKYSSYGISHLLIYQMIKFAIRKDIKYFSFWGVNLDKYSLKIKSWEGFSSFKLGFKPKVVRLIGPLILPITAKGRISYLRDWIGHIRLLFNF